MPLDENAILNQLKELFDGTTSKELTDPEWIELLNAACLAQKERAEKAEAKVATLLAAINFALHKYMQQHQLRFTSMLPDCLLELHAEAKETESFGAIQISLPVDKLKKT